MRDWDRTDTDHTKGCRNGVKLRVFVENVCLSRAPVVIDIDEQEDYTTTMVPTKVSEPDESGVYDSSLPCIVYFVVGFVFLTLTP